MLYQQILIQNFLRQKNIGIALILNFSIVLNVSQTQLAKLKTKCLLFLILFLLDIKDSINSTGKIAKVSSEIHKTILSRNIQCNKCKYLPKNIPDLKQHIISQHVKLRQHQNNIII